MGRERVAWFSIGFAVACALSAFASVSVAQAQTQSSRGTDPSGPSATSRARLAAQDVDDNDAAPGIPPPIPQDDPSEVQEQQDGLDPAPRAGQRPVVQDGDPNYNAEPPVIHDGIVDVGEPLPPEDGTDPSVVDTRPQEDVDAFENPPAGHDPLLFSQVEDLDPILDNRSVRRLASLDPYDPIGIKIGSFVLFPEAEFGTSWYSNVFRAPSASADWALDVAPSARLASNWTRHALEFRSTGDLSFYNEFDSENDKGYLAETRGRLDITRRTNLQGLLSHERTQESRSALDASSAGSRANQTTDRAEVALNHRFNRLSVQLRGSVGDFAFGDVENLGVTSSNSDRAYTEYEQTARASWEFKPTFTAFAEVEVNQRNYDNVARSDLINRSSNGERYRSGISFGNTGQILRGEIGLGYGVQRPDDSRLKEIDGLIVDANATWRMTELTSLLFTARSDISETTTTNVGGSKFQSFGIEARHALRRNIIATAGMTYATQDSQDGLIDESEVRSTLGVEYFLNREVALLGRYAHTNFDAIGAASDYTSDEVHVGMRIRR